MATLKTNFKHFLLHENKYYLGNQIGDILTAVQELQQNSEGMGMRQVVSNVERIINSIRGILHSEWSEKEKKYLKELQKVALALSIAVDEKDDLTQILPTVSSALEKISADLGVPVNSMGDNSSEPKDSAQPEQEQPQHKSNEI